MENSKKTFYSHLSSKKTQNIRFTVLTKLLNIVLLNKCSQLILLSQRSTFFFRNKTLL